MDDHSEVHGDHVRIIEGGARRGLESQAKVLPAIVRMNLIELLESAGIKEVELGSFTSPRWAPQMADTAAICALLGAPPLNRIRSVMVPDMNGLEMAVANGCRDITIASAASDAYCRANLNCNITESLRRADEISQRALAIGIQVRATLSTIIHCPFSGPVTTAEVTRIVRAFYDMGCREISLCDTTGTGTPASVGVLLRACATEVPMHRLAAHFHDTFGLAIANVIEALEHGMRAFDSAISGLGGDTHAPGAAGSIATEDLVYLFSELGINCTVDLDDLLLAADYIDCVLERRTESRVGRALRARRSPRKSSTETWVG
ncbi:MAG: hydroxymethylglutaryl-CoA lyase [Stenotrophomonas sp.]